MPWSRHHVRGCAPLMTSLATVVGLMPMALGLGTGSETNAPLARAVVGGLTVSTILTLFLVPTVYAMLEERFPRSTEQLAGTRVGEAGDSADIRTACTIAYITKQNRRQRKAHAFCVENVGDLLEIGEARGSLASR